MQRYARAFLLPALLAKVPHVECRQGGGDCEVAEALRKVHAADWRLLTRGREQTLYSARSKEFGSAIFGADGQEPLRAVVRARGAVRRQPVVRSLAVKDAVAFQLGVGQVS